MANEKTKNLIIATIMLVLLCTVSGVGCFALSMERRQKAEISQAISAHERQIESLRRENEELSVRIAEQENPSKLNKRTSARLVSPKSKGSVVLAYRNYDAGAISTPAKGGKLLSFKEPEIGRKTAR